MFDLLVAIIGFLLVLSFLVVIHEFGHFIAAKIFGIRVDEFGLGYPPRVKTLFRWRGTDLTLNLTPLGGFVRLHGEERDAQEKQKGTSDKFYAKPAWQRVIVLVAGAAINFIFGILAFSIMYTFIGIPEPRTLTQGVVVTAISQGSPAQESNLKPGDTIKRYKFEDDYLIVQSADEFVSTVKDNAGKTVELEFTRQENETEEVGTASVYIRTLEETPAKDGALGIGITQETIELINYPWWQMPFRGAWVGLLASLEFGLMIILGIGNMLRGAFSGVIPSQLSGPVGIASEVYKQRIFSGGIVSTLNFMAIISINLAIVNLLPIPALDGGRIVVLWLEKISENLFGRPFKPVYEQYANAIGMLFLLALIVVITIKDVGVIFSDAGIF